ncbi:DUF3883 domain-containing protein [Tenacibaculum sp. nBUS_03]|uniref:DUF3883 domain-containing protein n=1 Tax=Tenacibaculum sp. nBUS_03 TaxID=3395320 RepID=UPI003EBC8D42
MKLDTTTKEHILSAAKEIDHVGIDKNSLNNKYWVVVEKKEYPFKHLLNNAYKLANNTNENLNFKSTEHYRNYVKSMGFDIKFYPQNINFLKKHEIEHYKKVAGKKYRKANDEDVRYSQLIAPNVKKLNFLAENTVIENFYAKLDNHWQWSGTFKTYLWIRIYREGDSEKVYFVLGINRDGNLYLDLNCQRSNHSGGKTKALSKETIDSFDRYLKEADYYGMEIKFDDIENYSWEGLIQRTQNYLYKYASLYDELELLTKTGIVPEQIATLIESDIPEKTKSYAKEKGSFKGKKIDWSKKQLTSSKLGLLGEELVIGTEKQKLKKLGFYEEMEKVEKKLDGEGYDILSFDKHKNELYIEVKTTKGGKDEPFYISANEKAFCEANKSNYRIYRLYNYNYHRKTANYYIIQGTDLSKFDLTPINFEVSKK